MQNFYVDIPGTSANVTGEFSPSGLKNGGKMTVVTLTDSEWTPLPPTALTKRNTISVQNQSAGDMKIQFDNTTVGFVGTLLSPNAERFYDITDSIIIYGKSRSGNIDILIEELS